MFKLIGLMTYEHTGCHGNKREIVETEKRTKVVDRATLTVSQDSMHSIKSDRQVNYKPIRESAEFRPPHARENPQVLGLALAVHHYSRNKMLMDLLIAHDYCVSYGRTLLIETALANVVVENTREFEGLYVPPFLKKGAFVFFAIDNTDFSETLLMGKKPPMGRLLLYTRRQMFLAKQLHHP